MKHLHEVAQKLVAPGKGILAADESTGTIIKRFAPLGIKSTPENRRKYRQVLFTTDKIEHFISGVILYDETIRQKADNGKKFVTILKQKGIVPGIKVDEGKKDLPKWPREKYIQGMDNLSARLDEYVKLGAEFTKWRAVFVVSTDMPSDAAVDISTSDLALYALLAQNAGLVPIVEPEVLIEGKHEIHQSALATTRVLKKLFEKLDMYGVDLKGMLLKPNWVHEGLDKPGESDSMQVAKATISVLKHTVPDELPGIVFLSGGDTPEDSTKHLNAINKLGDKVPWELSFSFGRALQAKALEAWAGKAEQVAMAQRVFYDQAVLESLARKGKYE